MMSSKGEKLYQEELRLRAGLEKKHIHDRGIKASQEQLDILWEFADHSMAEAWDHGEIIEGIKRSYERLARLMVPTE